MTNLRGKRLHCPIKGHTRVYFDRWDMFACLQCNAWLDDQCDCPAAECDYAETAAPRDPSLAVKAGASYEEMP